MGHWECKAEYADGFEINKNMPYTAENWHEENEEQYAYEEWLVTAHDDCTYYSVAYADD